MHDDNAGLSAADLLELNRELQGSRAIRLLATTNLGLYATLMERHLSDGAVPSTELVVRFERDFDDLDDAVAMLDTAYLGHVIVLWWWALNQPNADAADSTTVRFRSLDGRDREIAVPRLTFTEPITTIAGAAA